MKTKLNIFCVCIIVSLLLAMSGVVNVLLQMFIGGVKAGMEAAETGIFPHIPTYEMALTLPTDLFEQTGTLENLKDGSQVAVKPLVSLMEVPEQEANPWSGPISLLLLVMLAYALVQFFKLIRNIHHNIIFDWQNVKRLRRLGLALISTFVLYIVTTLISNQQMADIISLRGCEFSITLAFSDPLLPLGFVSLLIAEIFAIGLQMKEEQDLTI